MTRFLLIRHAINDYVRTHRLAGWTEGVHLSEHGRAQARALGKRMAAERLDQLYASPLERTMETAAAIQQQQPQLKIRHHDGFGEVRYGDWEGASLHELARRKAWRVVQEYPSRARFPNGETMRGVQTRVVDALEELALTWPGARVAVVFHADLIRMALAHYLGMHLDNFQRIDIAPASISRLSLGHGRPWIHGMNDVSHLQGLKHGPNGRGRKQGASNSTGEAAHGRL
ncbi:MAG: MSMEG_4193 family putative phosphomutase [Anaerolineaceae bacterium]|nr:MSMEG_4193 family putative phosphomutase [Anaerolineaceae bacterium]MDE0328377.1 MSMEG_4193 family putative phosphomutase [Anaerolineaceae bacterium]